MHDAAAARRMKRDARLALLRLAASSSSQNTLASAAAPSADLSAALVALYADLVVPLAADAAAASAAAASPTGRVLPSSTPSASGAMVLTLAQDALPADSGAHAEAELCNLLLHVCGEAGDGAAVMALHARLQVLEDDDVVPASHYAAVFRGVARAAQAAMARRAALHAASGGVAALSSLAASRLGGVEQSLSDLQAETQALVTFAFDVLDEMVGVDGASPTPLDLAGLALACAAARDADSISTLLHTVDRLVSDAQLYGTGGDGGSVDAEPGAGAGADVEAGAEAGASVVDDVGSHADTATAGPTTHPLLEALVLATTSAGLQGAAQRLVADTSRRPQAVGTFASVYDAALTGFADADNLDAAAAVVRTLGEAAVKCSPAALPAVTRAVRRAAEAEARVQRQVAQLSHSPIAARSRTMAKRRATRSGGHTSIAALPGTASSEAAVAARWSRVLKGLLLCCSPPRLGHVTGTDASATALTLTDYAALVDASGVAGDLRGAFAWFDGLQEQGLAPADDTYVALLRACRVAGHANRASKVLAFMLEHGATVSLVAFDEVLSAHVESGNAQQAWDVLGLMQEPPHSLVPSEAMLTKVSEQKSVFARLLCARAPAKSVPTNQPPADAPAAHAPQSSKYAALLRCAVFIIRVGQSGVFHVTGLWVCGAPPVRVVPAPCGTFRDITLLFLVR